LDGRRVTTVESDTGRRLRPSTATCIASAEAEQPGISPASRSGAHVCASPSTKRGQRNDIYSVLNCAPPRFEVLVFVVLTLGAVQSLGSVTSSKARLRSMLLSGDLPQFSPSGTLRETTPHTPADPNVNPFTEKKREQKTKKDN